MVGMSALSIQELADRGSCQLLLPGPLGPVSSSSTPREHTGSREGGGGVLTL